MLNRVSATDSPGAHPLFLVKASMSIDFVFRLIGMVGLAVGGVYLGIALSGVADTPPELWAVVFGLVGALIGLVTTPLFTTRPARAIRDRIMQMPASGLIAGLLSFPLSLLPAPFSQILPVAIALLFVWLGISVFVMRQRDIFSLFRGRVPGRLAAEGAGVSNEGRSVLLDTSVIIDGRIADISHTGFVSGTILVPKFVLNELQHIADSPDALRRNRGRRGLEVLNRLQKESTAPVRFSDQ